MFENENLLLSQDNESDTIALALSGGGARAMAFHLGCLRALRELGILQRVSTITAVSGGSVIAGLYCSHPGDFEDFEIRIREVLRRGFIVPALRQLFFSLEGTRAIGYASALAVERTVALCFRLIIKLAGRAKAGAHWPNASPFLRKASRTTLLRRVFSKTFRGCMLRDLRRDRPDLIVIACELRAKAAFYYTRDSLHCWRYGSSKSEGIELADAVIASAAYPAALPALDQRLVFNKDGVESSHRVTLTDGGVYDNLGLAPLWPERSFSESLKVSEHNIIIACRAGYGLEVTEPASIWMSRMGAAFESVFARAQNLATNRLFDLKKAGRLKGVLLLYLGQKDSSLKFPCANMVSADATAGYPTNFRAMDDRWIELLVMRGEQMVHAQVEEHWKSYMTNR